MKKLLAALASITMIASSASTVLACSTTQAVDNADTAQSKAFRQESIDSLKSFAIADQFGTDLTKTQRADVQLDSDNFMSPDASVTKGLNLDGTLGKDNLPLYKWNDQLNKFLGTFGVEPIDLTPYLNEWGGVIKQIPSLINSKNINSLLQLLPATILSTAGLITGVPIDSGSIEWVTDWIKANVVYVLKELDFNSRIKDMIDEAAKNKVTPNLSYIESKGLDDLQEIANIMLTSYTNEKPDNYQKGSKLFDPEYDNSVSLFLGKEIFTKLFNGQSIDGNSIKSHLTNSATLAKAAGRLKRLINDLGGFLASLMLQLSVYVPMTMNLTTGLYLAGDQDHLFFTKDKDGKLVSAGSNDEVFKKYDSAELTYDKTTGDIKFKDPTQGDGLVHNVSLDNSIYGAIDLVSNTDENSFGIQRLTNILFHDSSDGMLIDRLTYWLIDALKFTDYQVVAKKDVKLPAGLGTITIDTNFNISEMFKENEILIVKSVPAAVAGLLGWTSILGRPYKDLQFAIELKNNGLLGMYKKAFVPLLSKVLLNASVDSSWVKNELAKIAGSKGDTFVLSGKAQKWVSDGIFSGHYETEISQVAGITAWNAAVGIYGDSLAKVLDKILESLYYTNGTKFFDALKGTGFVSDDQLEDIKKNLGDKLPLAQTVLATMQNTAIGDLTEYSGLVRLDNIANILKILFLENPIQDSAAPDKGTDTKSLADDNQGPKSLFQQILISIDSKYDETRAAEWNYYLGYLSKDQIAGQSNLVKNNHYVLKEGLIGNIIQALYPGLDTANDITKNKTIDEIPTAGFPAPKQPASDGGDDGPIITAADDLTYTVINLENLEILDSEVMDKLDAATATLSHDLQGDDVDDIVDEILNATDEDKIWTTSNYVNRFFGGSKDLRYQSYDLTFDTTSLVISHTDKDGNITTLPSHKVTYRVIYSRSDNNSKFEFKSIEKIS